MGEIVKVKQDGIISADLMLIYSNLPDGVCFIEASTLDGEKTFKIKSSPNFTKEKFYKIFISPSNPAKIEIKNINSLLQKNPDLLSLNRKNSEKSSGAPNSISKRPSMKKNKIKKKRVNDTNNEVFNNNSNMNICSK